MWWGRKVCWAVARIPAHGERLLVLTQLWIWWCGVRLRWVVQEWDVGLARSQTLPSMMVLAKGGCYRGWWCGRLQR